MSSKDVPGGLTAPTVRAATDINAAAVRALINWFFILDMRRSATLLISHRGNARMLGKPSERGEEVGTINTFHFSERIIRSEPGGKREGAGLETPYELDVESLSPASIESKALAKGAHAIEKQVVLPNVLPNENGADWQAAT